MLRTILTFLCLIGIFFPLSASAEENYAGVTVAEVQNWTLGQMQTFSGTVPSRVWVFEKKGEEVAVSVLSTGGIENALRDQKLTSLVKIYTDALVTGWGGKSNGNDTGLNAAFCGGEAGYHSEASFGDRKFDYYGCMLMSRDRTRVVSVVTWADSGTSEEVIARRLLTYIQAISFDVNED